MRFIEKVYLLSSTPFSLKTNHLIPRFFLPALAVSAVILLSCAGKNKTLTYLALGDSYTIGESVKESERWPVQLANRLTEEGLSVASPKIIATTGWRTDDLMEGIQLDGTTEKYDLVSLLIGVNNQYQGKSIKAYEEELPAVFDKAISMCKHGKKGVFAVTIPDYGSTPFGKTNAQRIGLEIDRWNAVFMKVAKQKGIPCYDINPISKKGATDVSSLVAKDGLHPNGKQYGLWVDSFWKEVKAIAERL